MLLAREASNNMMLVAVWRLVTGTVVSVGIGEGRRYLPALLRQFQDINICSVSIGYRRCACSYVCRYTRVAVVSLKVGSRLFAVDLG